MNCKAKNIRKLKILSYCTITNNHHFMILGVNMLCVCIIVTVRVVSREFCLAYSLKNNLQSCSAHCFTHSVDIHACIRPDFGKSVFMSH